MGYLVVSILFLSAMAVLLRQSVARGATPLTLNLVFRGSAALFMLVPFLLGREAAGSWKAGGWLALVAAVSFWLTGIASIKCVQLGPLGPSWTILRCSMILPVAASVFYWHEVSLWPVSGVALMRLSGIVLGVVAVIVCGLSRPASALERRPLRPWLLWMAAAFLSQGVWEICLRATRGFGAGESRALFLLFVFAASCVLTLPALAVTRTRMSGADLKYGTLLGLCAFLGTGCRVLALKTVDGTIVFPVTTVSVMLAAQAAGRFFWAERLPRAVFGLALGIAAVLLLTLG